MRTNKVLALFMPSETPFYFGLFKAMKKSFETNGFSVVGACQLLEDKELKNFINQYNPSIFFEMNRCKAEINHFPENILHICWIVDLWGRKLSDIKGSEIIYFFSTEWLKDFKADYHCKIDWLPPASDPDTYFPIKNSEKLYNSVFVGHISNPWEERLLKRIIYKKNNTEILFSDILDNFEYPWAIQDDIVNNDCYIKEVTAWIKKRFSVNVDINDSVLRYDIGCRIIRKGRREVFLDWLLSNTQIQPLAIFGSENWTKWAKYKPYYKNELKTPNEMNKVFNQSNTVIHEGVGFHFRLFDAMLSGIPILLRKSKQDSLEGGLNTYFEENIDYISYDLSKTNNSYTNTISKETLKEISENGRKKALKYHTWDTRLLKVAKDINEFYQ